MGWTYTNKDKHVSAGEYIKSELLVWNNPDAKYTLLDGGVVKFRTYYGAVERIDLKTNERRVFAVVILLNYAKGYHNFGYKDMDESCGPVESNCPERILKLLTPTDSEYANEWRQRCWAKIKSKKDKPKIQENMTLLYGGKSYKVTRVLGRRGYMVESDGGVYRMKATQAKEATVVA
jgi:hypothetical protein